MKIAIPTIEGNLCQHFGHCQVFSVFTVEDKKIVAEEALTPPPHEPGVLPRWLSEQQVEVIISGGMGQRAQQLFADSGIKTIVGVQAMPAKEAVEQYLTGSLLSGTNFCDH